MNFRNCAIVALISCLPIAGCSHQEDASMIPMVQSEASFASNDTSWTKHIATARVDKRGGMAGMGMEIEMDMASKEAEAKTEPPLEIADGTPGKRRVIFESNIELRVNNFDGIESKISALVDRHQGFISEANVSHQVSKSRTAYWTIRVPATAYRQLLDSVGCIGELESRKENADDVTAEFYDLEARIKNKQRLEERIAKLLDETKSELRKMIEVEQELARVREEIERMQGRLRYLTDVTGMSTIHLRVLEREKERTPVVAATFSARISNAWNSALTQATNTIQNTIVAFVENIFHIATALVMFTLIWLIVRIHISRMAQRAV